MEFPLNCVAAFSSPVACKIVVLILFLHSSHVLTVTVLGLVDQDFSSEFFHFPCFAFFFTNYISRSPSPTTGLPTPDRHKVYISLFLSPPPALCGLNPCFGLPCLDFHFPFPSVGSFLCAPRLIPQPFPAFQSIFPPAPPDWKPSLANPTCREAFHHLSTPILSDVLLNCVF